MPSFTLAHEDAQCSMCTHAHTMPKTRLTAALCSIKNNDTGIQTPRATTSTGPTVPPSTSTSPQEVRQFFSTFDANVSADLCDMSDLDSSDSDQEELPDMLSPHQTCKTIPEKGDPVWVKYRQHHFWPGLVLQSNQKTRKLHILFLDQLNGRETDHGEKIYLKYNKKNVVPFTHEKKKQFELEGRGLSGDLQKRFSAAMLAMDDYLTKRALGHASACRAFLTDTEDRTEQQLQQQQQAQDKPQQQHQVDEDASDVEGGSMTCAADTTTTSKTHKRRLTPDERRELRKERNQPLVDYICSLEMKDYLVKIWKGVLTSERHQQFNKGLSQQSKLQGNSLGPIDDDEQLDKVVEQLSKWLGEVTGQVIPNSDYLFGVWLPEAIVKAIQKVRRCSWQRALESFSQGVRLVQCERLEIHKSMINKT